MLSGGTMHKQYNIAIAYLFQFFNGFGIGSSYISRYIVILAGAYHFGHYDLSLGLVVAVIYQITAYLMEVKSGYRADIYGEKITLFSSMFTRILCLTFVCASVLIPEPSPYLFTLFTIISYMLFGISLSYYSGNFHDWVQENCQKDDSLRVFSILSVLLVFGLVLSLSASILMFEETTYKNLFSAFLPVVLLCFSGFFLAMLCSFMIKSEKPFEIKAVFKFIASYNLFNKNEKQKTSGDIQQARQELAANSTLNKVLWVQSGLYGVYMALESLLPIYVFASQNFDMTEKFILLIMCVMMPYAIGSLIKLFKGKSAQHHLGYLYKELILYFSVVIMIAVVSVFPFSKSLSWFQDPVFIAFAFFIVISEILSGSILTQFYDYTTKLAQETTKFSKTVLSIGERRKKIGAIMSLAIAVSGTFLNIKEAYFWVVALLALISLVYSVYVFRELLGKDSSKRKTA